MNYIQEFLSLPRSVREGQNIAIIVLNGVEHDYPFFKKKVLNETEIILKNEHLLNLDVRILKILNQIKDELT